MRNSAVLFHYHNNFSTRYLAFVRFQTPILSLWWSKAS